MLVLAWNYAKDGKSERIFVQFARFPNISLFACSLHKSYQNGRFCA